MSTVRIRVREEVDELVRLLAEREGYMPSAVRNVAILIGVRRIAVKGMPVKTEKGFRSFLEETRLIVMRRTPHAQEV